MPRPSKKKVRLYQFYNMVKSENGSPFALCDQHRESQITPDVCILNKIADKAIDECNQCRWETTDA